MEKSFGVIGGDRRQAELARLLEADFCPVCTYGLRCWKAPRPESLERVVQADIIVLPLPLCRGDGVLNCAEAPMTTMDLFRMLRPEQVVLAGQVQMQQKQEAELYGLELKDYFQREELTVANAAATAEAAIQVAMEHLERTLLGLECLVLGFGRIGKLLSCRLAGLGARVTATARKPADLAWIRAFGFRAEETMKLDHALMSYGIVFNTIPHLILDEKLLSRLNGDCLCVDLASKQGIDPEAAERLNLNYVWARSLPGRFIPCTAAEVIRDAVYHILSEG